MHILTPESAVAPSEHVSGRWHSETSFVNRFQEDEWPYQELATIRNLSLGEEQSESKVGSLSWSSACPSAHKRSILAILTSNLVLSFWESNGMSGSWLRTHIVNPKTSATDTESTGFKRRGQRIRAFTWLPALKYPRWSKWGMHWLLTVDNNNNLITRFRMQKKASDYSSWELENVFQSQLWTSGRPEVSGEASLLENLLVTQSTITRITSCSWQKLRDEEGSTQLSRIRLNFTRGAVEGPPTDDSYMLEVEPSGLDLEFTGRRLSPKSTTRLDDLASSQDFTQVVAKPVEDFSAKYNLAGQVRVRYWGFARDLASSGIAACITLHLLDMIECTPSSGE